MRSHARSLRTLLLCGFAVMLAACTTTRVTEPVAIKDKGVLLFQSACMATAPSFAGAMAAGKRHGIVSGPSLGDLNMGSTSDNSVTLQVTPNKECAVTTSNRSGSAVEAEFLTAVSKATGLPLETLSSPVKAKYKGAGIIFAHKRSGGEAYVMLHAQ